MHNYSWQYSLEYKIGNLWHFRFSAASDKIIFINQLTRILCSHVSQSTLSSLSLLSLYKLFRNASKATFPPAPIPEGENGQHHRVQRRYI